MTYATLKITLLISKYLQLLDRVSMTQSTQEVLMATFDMAHMIDDFFLLIAILHPKAVFMILNSFINLCDK